MGQNRGTKAMVPDLDSHSTLPLSISRANSSEVICNYNHKIN